MMQIDREVLYREALGLVFDWSAKFSVGERNAILGDNSRRFYSLD